MTWNENDLFSKFLMAKPIELKGIGTLQPITINEISKVGFSVYNQYLSILCISSDDISEMLDLEDDRVIEPFEFIINNCLYGDESFRNQIMDAFNFFFKDEIGFYETYFCVGDISRCKFIQKSNYNFFIDILKQMNCVNPNVEKEKPKNEAEKKFWKKLKEIRAKYEKHKDTMDINDIISAVAAKHPSINLLNVGSLTIYQLIDQYRRLNSIEQYDLNINSLIHGCDSKNVNLKHWSGKL